MSGLGVSEDEARYYETAFREGKAIVAVKPGTHSEEAMQILLRHGGYNLCARLGSPVPTEGTFSQP